jgi:hypothetical protein
MATHVIGVGEWMHTLLIRMNNAVDGDCFRLPTDMHFHAYNLLKEDFFPDQTFTVEIKNSVDV